MEPLVEHRLLLAGYETRALELEGEGPPLLLLHGWADSADTWRLLLDVFARAGRRALAVDLPGFGTADRLADGAVLPQLDHFVAAALREAAPDGGALLVGNSLGACAALRAAENTEGEVGGVVAIAPAGLDMARWFGIVERDAVVRSLLASPLPVPGPVVRRAVEEAYRRLAFRRPGSVDPRVISTFAGHLGSKAAAGRILASGRRLLPELRHPFQLDRIDCPVLLVWGDDDVMVSRKGADLVLAAIPEARLEAIEDCGHCPQIERPDVVAELVMDFPETVRRAA